MPNIRLLGNSNTLIDRFVSELRDVNIQNDRMRFRRNLERIGEISAYEISKILPFRPLDVTTPLGISTMPDLASEPVLATILRAGLPLHQGLLNYFDRADNAYVSAYRTEHNESGEFEIKIEYLASPSIDGRTLIISDPMLATGRSLLQAFEAVLTKGTPAHIHIVVAIASKQGLDHIAEALPKNSTIWVAALDPELNDHSYIVPGLGDAGDLAFGVKE